MGINIDTFGAPWLDTQPKGNTMTDTNTNNGKTVTGDLISMAEQGEFDVIIHGCNCFCTMGSGIADQIRKQYPQAYAADCATEKGNKNKLGLFTAVDIDAPTISDGEIDPHTFTIVNLYTQFNYDPKTKPVNYEAIRKGFIHIKETFRGMRIGYPLIGAGLAGGDWNIISKIINKELEGEDHTLVEWDQLAPTRWENV